MQERETAPTASDDRRAVVRRAFVDSLPVLMGYTTMGFVAGVLLAAKANLAHATVWGFLSSLLCVSGTFNFAIVQPVAERVPWAAVALLVVGINFRYAFYGFSMLSRWKGVPPLKKAFLVFMLSDENYALEDACAYREPSRHVFYCLVLSAMNLSYWVGGVTAGAAVVAVLQGALDPAVIQRYTNGMDFAMAALFIVILTDQVRGFFGHAG